MISATCSAEDLMPQKSKPVESIDVQKIINYSTKSSLEFTRRGMYYEEKKEFQNALGDYTRALELTPNRSELLIRRSICYKELEQYELAIKDLTEVLSMRPYRAEVYSMRGKIYTTTEKYELALWDFDKAVELNPLKPDFYIDRGDFYSKIEEKDYAKRDYDAAAELIAYNAKNYKMAKQWQLAIDEYSKAIARNPEKYEFKKLRQECIEALEAEIKATEEAAAEAEAAKRKKKKGKLPKEELQR